VRHRWNLWLIVLPTPEGVETGFGKHRAPPDAAGQVQSPAKFTARPILPATTIHPTAVPINSTKP
jgi:hypothetical protein